MPLQTDGHTIIFHIDEQFFEKNIEISRLNISNTNCMENVAWMIKDLNNATIDLREPEGF